MEAFKSITYDAVFKNEYILNFKYETMPWFHSHTWEAPVFSLALYMGFLFWWAPKVEKVSAFATRAVKWWNLFLWGMSVLMFVGLAVPWTRTVFQTGLTTTFCDPKNTFWEGDTMFWIWLFALSKFAELFDTWFLVYKMKFDLRKNFLHWYHHVTVLAYTWFAVYNRVTVGFVFGMVNAFVHCVMYGYFFLAAIGRKPWFGRYITQLQITQMFVGMGAMIWWAVLHAKLGDEQCPSDAMKRNIASALIMYGSYAYLFISFYRKKHAKKE